MPNTGENASSLVSRGLKVFIGLEKGGRTARKSRALTGFILQDLTPDGHYKVVQRGSLNRRAAKPGETITRITACGHENDPAEIDEIFESGP